MRTDNHLLWHRASCKSENHGHVGKPASRSEDGMRDEDDRRNRGEYATRPANALRYCANIHFWRYSGSSFNLQGGQKVRSMITSNSSAALSPRMVFTLMPVELMER